MPTPPEPLPPPIEKIRPHAVLIALIAIGLALRVWQYLADMSMWFDELSVARNVGERSLGELVLRPLAYSQIAPPGFLTLVKSSTLFFGWSDLALRLFPFICGIIALFLFWRVAVQVLDGVGASVAVALFALGMPFVRYSAELKQYGVDVAATLALTLVALDLRAGAPTTRRCILAGLTGLAIVWFSQASVFVMAGLGLAFVGGWLAARDSTARRPVMITAPIWGAASLAALMVSMHLVTPKTLAFMHAFWASRQAFFPLPPRSARDLLWLWDRIVQLFGDKMMLGYPWPMLFSALAILGFAAIWRRRRDVALILLGPVAVTVAAAVAQQYPFRTRVVLFLLPSFLLAIAASVEWVRARAATIHPLLGWAVPMALVAPPVYTLYVMPPPYYVEAFKPVLGYVQAHRRAGDAVYVYSNAYEAIDHYGASFGLPAGTYVLGICDERDIRPYLRDVDRFRGGRVWVIGSSVPHFRQPRQAIGRYLETIGIRRASFTVPSLPPLDPVSAELFDVSDAKRLQAATASTFELRAIADTLHPFCDDWIRPTPGRPGERE